MADDGIKYSEIVPDDALNKLKKDGEDLIKIFTQLGAVIRTSMGSFKGGLSGGAPKSIGDVEGTNASIKKVAELAAANDKVVASIDRLQKENDKIRASEIQLQQAREKAFDKFEAQENKKVQLLQKENDKIREQNRPYVQLSGTLARLRKDYQDLAAGGRENGKVARGLAKEIQILDGHLKKVDASVGIHNRNVGDYKQSLGKLRGSLLEVGAAVGIGFGVGQVINFGKEAVQAAAKLEGIETAFNKLNRPELLAELRKATKGTVSDLVLMQSAVKANNFQLPLDQLGKLFQFAQQRAQETGESVEYLTESIVLGISRKSIPILDNLGLSSQQIQKEFKKTGDFAKAVGNIVDESLTKQGEIALTTADKIAQITATWENFKVEVGKFLIEAGSGFVNLKKMLAGDVTFEEIVDSKTLQRLRDNFEKETAEYLIIAKNSEEKRTQFVSEANKHIIELSKDLQDNLEMGFIKAGSLEQKAASQRIKDWQKFQEKLRHLNDKAIVEKTAEELKAEEDLARKLRDLRTGNLENDYDRAKQIIRDHYADEAKKYKGHAAILVELKIKLKNDLDKIDDEYFKKEKEKTKKHQDELQAYDMKNLSYDLKAEKAKEQKKEDEAKAKRNKEIQNEIELTERLVKAYDERYQKIADIKRDQIDADIDSAESNMEIQAQLAARGLDNTLAYEMEKKAALEQARVVQLEQEKKHAQAMEAAELGLAFIQAYQNYIEKDMPAGQALSRAAADIFAAKIFSTAIAGSFAEGVEDFKGKGTGTSDSNIIEFSNGESVVTAKGTQETPGLVTALNEAGYAGAVDWFYKQEFDSGIQLSDVSVKSQSEKAHTLLLAKKIDELTQVVKDKPVSNSSIDGLGNTITTLLQNGNKYTHTKKRHLI